MRDHVDALSCAPTESLERRASQACRPFHGEKPARFALVLKEALQGRDINITPPLQTTLELCLTRILRLLTSPLPLSIDKRRVPDDVIHI